MTRKSPQSPSERRRLFLTVHEAAEMLRVDARTIYRAIAEDAFPAVKIRGRHIVPTRAVEALADEAVELGRLIDAADYAVVRRTGESGGSR